MVEYGLPVYKNNAIKTNMKSIIFRANPKRIEIVNIIFGRINDASINRKTADAVNIIMFYFGTTLL